MNKKIKIGCDMVDVSRFNNFERLKDKILSLKEIEIYSNYKDKRLYVASRFCLKEAFLKSLGKGIFDYNLKEIEVLKRKSGEIYILFEGNEYSCSLSHEGNFCIGVALYE